MFPSESLKQSPYARRKSILNEGVSHRITDWGVCKLARGCNRLRYIDLAGDSLLSDLSVFELAANCPKLKRVGLVRVRTRVEILHLELVHVR
jgi:hypothetical protein